MLRVLAEDGFDSFEVQLPAVAPTRSERVHAPEAQVEAQVEAPKATEPSKVRRSALAYVSDASVPRAWARASAEVPLLPQLPIRQTDTAPSWPQAHSPSPE